MKIYRGSNIRIVYNHELYLRINYGRKYSKKNDTRSYYCNNNLRFPYSPDRAMLNQWVVDF